MIESIIIVLVYFSLLPVILGICSFFGGVKYKHTPERKKELLNEHLILIKDKNVIQGFPHNGWAVSYCSTSDRAWFYPKIYDYFYKWAVYYRFKWFDKC